MNKYMKLAKNTALKGILKEEGGPFGAIITDKNGNIISRANNQVLLKKDPTAHAEIQAIRKASKKLNKYDLSECILYTSCEPCPMCLSAIIWANIKEVYYGCTKNDADKIGFRDDKIYKFINKQDPKTLTLKELDRDECLEVFKKYSAENKIIY